MLLLELDHEEGPLLLELLKRRLKELEVEEHRSETFRYRDMLHRELALLERLQQRLEDAQASMETPGGAAR